MGLMSTTSGLTDVPLHTIDNNEGTAVEEVMSLTGGKGVDLVVEAIGVPAGWYICQDIVKAGTAIDCDLVSGLLFLLYYYHQSLSLREVCFSLQTQLSRT